MDNNTKNKIKELREQTGMNRKEFCDYFAIPYPHPKQTLPSCPHKVEYYHCFPYSFSFL